MPADRCDRGSMAGQPHTEPEWCLRCADARPEFAGECLPCYAATTLDYIERFTERRAAGDLVSALDAMHTAVQRNHRLAEFTRSRVGVLLARIATVQAAQDALAAADLAVDCTGMTREQEDAVLALIEAIERGHNLCDAALPDEPSPQVVALLEIVEAVSALVEDVTTPARFLEAKAAIEEALRTWHCKC